MSKKNVDQKGRFRNKIISFRVSEEEAKLLKRRVLLSGLTKQDYIINSILGKEIVVYGNPFVFRSLHDELIHFANLYGTSIDSDDEEMMVWVLEMILAMRSKDKTIVKPSICFQKCFHMRIVQRKNGLNKANFCD